MLATNRYKWIRTVTSINELVTKWDSLRAAAAPNTSVARRQDKGASRDIARSAGGYNLRYLYQASGWTNPQSDPP